MFYLPQYKEEVESTLEKEEVLRRLKIVVKHTAMQSHYHHKLEEEPELEIYLFNGLVSNTGFSISLVIDKPENFFPIINGKIVEDNLAGSRIQIQYTLFKSVKLFYSFWITLLSAIAIYFLYVNQAWHWIALSILIQIASFLVMQARFRAGVIKSRKELRRLLL